MYGYFLDLYDGKLILNDVNGRTDYIIYRLLDIFTGQLSSPIIIPHNHPCSNIQRTDQENPLLFTDKILLGCQTEGKKYIYTLFNIIWGDRQGTLSGGRSLYGQRQMYKTREGNIIVMKTVRQYVISIQLMTAELKYHSEKKIMHLPLRTDSIKGLFYKEQSEILFFSYDKNMLLITAQMFRILCIPKKHWNSHHEFCDEVKVEISDQLRHKRDIILDNNGNLILPLKLSEQKEKEKTKKIFKFFRLFGSDYQQSV
jgi:hypothetical protein